MADDDPGASGRRRADALRNREKLVAAAGAVIAQSGPDASLEEIARRAGVGSATLHRHFSSRAELLHAVLQDRAAALCARADDLLQSPNAGQALITWLHAVVAHAAAARGFGPALAGYRPDTEFSPHAMITQAARQLLVRAQQHGAVNPTVEVQDLLHLANGLALAVQPLPDPTSRVDALMTLVTTGLLRSGGD